MLIIKSNILYEKVISKVVKQIDSRRYEIKCIKEILGKQQRLINIKA